ncbi:MAG: hypothetical protein K0U93_04305 [Gammaproteobacteria bacterium]|nr:hypothetical protein [Gammaproteobacteria bacterium]
MTKFLIIVAGVVVSLLVILGAVWFWLKGRQTRSAPHGSTGVPPFRIELTPKPTPTWQQEAEVDTFSHVIETSGFQRIGDFAIPQMHDLMVRGFCDRKRAAFAIIYEHPQVGLVLDLVRIHKGCTATVTSAPDDGLDHPGNTARTQIPFENLDEDGASATWAKMLPALDELCKDKTPIPALPKTFVAAFTSSYAAEMDWRIRRGGVTEDEVRRVALAGGQEDPAPDAIEQVKAVWRSTIDKFVGSEVIGQFLAAREISAVDWEQMRDRILVVHEYSETDALCDSLAALTDTPAPADDAEVSEPNEAASGLRAELGAAFTDAQVIDGFAAALELLPSTHRFEKIGSVQRPWRAEVYLKPSPAELAA